jgi:glycosyltransferase involved in cell wall biosynthesis
MVTKTDITARVAKHTAKAKTPVKVCMHVRGKARTDGRVMREATALSEAGFDISIVDVESEHSLPTEEYVCGIHVKHLIKPGWFIFPRFKAWVLVRALQKIVFSTLQLIRTPADIYHAHDLTALPACYMAAQVHRASLIFDAHELPMSALDGSIWYRFRKLFTYILTTILSQCAGVITVSPPIAQEIRSCYRALDVLLLRNVAAYQNIPKSDLLRQHLGLSPAVRIALYQGNLQTDRGLDRLIYAASFLEPDIVIVMMGKGSRTTQSQLEALIASEGVADRVKIIPAVPYADLLLWTASADVGLIIYSPDLSLNVRMCLPNKLFEYLMAGLPVLASRLDAVVDVLNSYQVGQVVSSLSPGEVGAAINAMVADRVALDRMHHNALKAVQRDLCWEEESQKLIQLYQDIIRQAEYSIESKDGIAPCL